MNREVKFTDGTLEKISDEYYNLVLTNLGKQVYKATLSNTDAVKLIGKHNGKIKML